MPLRRRDGRQPGGQPSSSPPPASAPSAPSSPPQPGQEEVRHVTREMQRLEVDVMKPLQDILDNPPSSDTTELVDLLLSEAHAKVEELHQQADFFVELGHFDVFQKIADLKGNFDDISARASSWKEAAVHSASSPAATPAATPAAAVTPAAATPAAATPPAASPSLSSAQGLHSSPAMSAKSSRQVSDDLPGLEAIAQPSPKVEHSTRSQAPASPGSAIQQSTRSQAIPSPGSATQQSTRSQAAGAVSGAFGGAQQSPSGTMQQSMKSQASAVSPVDPGPFGGVQSSGSATQQSTRSQAAGAVSGAFGGAQQSPSGTVQQSMKSQASAVSPVDPGPFGGVQSWGSATQQSTRSQAAGAVSGAFGGAQPSPSGTMQESMKSQASAAPSPFGPVEQTPWGLQSMTSQAQAPTMQDASQSTWQSPSWGTWMWGQPPSSTSDAGVTMPVQSQKSTPASRQKKMRQEAAKSHLEAALQNSNSDPHALSMALHEAKSVEVQDIAPELVQQAEAAVQEAHNVSLRADAERELASAASVVSANLQTKDVNVATLSRNTQLLETALKDAQSVGVQTKQADELLAEARAEEEKRRGAIAAAAAEAAAAARPEASPVDKVPSQSQSPATVPAKPQPASPKPEVPVAPLPEVPSIRPENPQMTQMKHKVAKLLQTLISGGSTAEQLRKAAEVAAAAGLENESLQAQSVAEERQLAHEEAVMALNSGDLRLIQKALKEVENAGGPAKDRQHLTQVLEMGDDRSSVTSMPPRGQPMTPAAWEVFREKEEQLVQHLREDRESQLEEFRNEVQLRIKSIEAQAATQPSKASTAPGLSLGQPAESRTEWRDPHKDVPQSAPDPTMRQFAHSTFGVQEDSSGSRQWTNPFGLDPEKTVFDPFGVPNYDYRTLLANARLRTQIHGKPFEQPDFWNLRTSKASNVMHF